MNKIKLSYLLNNQKDEVEFTTLPELIALCKTIKEFDPTLEDQLYSVNIEAASSGDGFEKYTISCEHENDMDCVEVSTVGELISVIRRVHTSPKINCFPPLVEQLANSGGWDKKEIDNYKNFIVEVQKNLPKDYRLVSMENKIDEFLEFWDDSPGDRTEIGNLRVAIGQLVELKKILIS